MIRSPRAAIAALTASILILLVACALAGFAATGRSGLGHHQIDLPPIGGHMYSIWLLPCDPFIPGQILFGRDLMIYSRYPPPGLSIPLSPPCP